MTSYSLTPVYNSYCVLISVGVFKGHKNGTFYVKACLSPDGRYLLSGSSDEHAYIWDTCDLKGDKYLPIVKLVGHNAEVTSVAWCPVGEVKVQVKQFKTSYMNLC